jgi:fructokinase
VKVPRGVVVIGEALVDVFADGARVAGGAPFNVARWLAAFGVPTTMISRIGAHDALADEVLASARRSGLACAAIQRDARRGTGRVDVALDAAGPRYTIEAEGTSAWDHIDPADALAAAAAAQPAVVVFGTLAQRHPASRGAIRTVLGATQALRFADLNLRDAPGMQQLAEETLRIADWVKVNDDEMAQLQRWFAPGLPGVAAERAIVERFGITRTLVTCGARGWYTLDAEGRRDGEGAAEPVPQLVDTVGAGDAFAAVVVAGLAGRRVLAGTLADAARLAAAVCGQRGAFPAQGGFLEHWRHRLGFAAGSTP